MLRHSARWIVPVLAAAILMVATGVGFSAFTASATVRGQASSGTIDLVVTAASLVGAPSYTLLQTTHLPASVVQLWINDTIPDTSYNLSLTVQNIGTVPAQGVTWSFSTNIHGPATCSVGAYTEVLASNDPPADTLGPGAAYGTNWIFHSGQEPPACEGQVWISFTISWVATAGI